MPRNMLKRWFSVNSEEAEEHLRKAEEKMNNEVRQKRKDKHHEALVGHTSNDNEHHIDSSSKMAAASSFNAGKKTRRRRAAAKPSAIDVNGPLEWPASPELVLEYHKVKPWLNRLEEWLTIELMEYELLLESEEIVREVAAHCKQFEVDPPELVEEFFEFVEEVPSYDEVLTTDVWQEFRDKKYPF